MALALKVEAPDQSISLSGELVRNVNSQAGPNLLNPNHGGGVFYQKFSLSSQVQRIC